MGPYSGSYLSATTTYYVPGEPAALEQVIGSGAFCIGNGGGRVALEEVEARADGTLVWPPRGTAGFGYDPAFLPNGHTRTFGEMTSIEKHGLPPLGMGLSHRARAFVKLAEICLD